MTTPVNPIMVRITDGKNPRGIPTAKFIVSIICPHIPPTPSRCDSLRLESGSVDFASSSYLLFIVDPSYLFSPNI